MKKKSVIYPIYPISIQRTNQHISLWNPNTETEWANWLLYSLLSRSGWIWICLLHGSHYLFIPNWACICMMDYLTSVFFSFFSLPSILYTWIHIYTHSLIHITWSTTITTSIITPGRTKIRQIPAGGQSECQHNAPYHARRTAHGKYAARHRTRRLDTRLHLDYTIGRCEQMATGAIIRNEIILQCRWGNWIPDDTNWVRFAHKTLCLLLLSYLDVIVYTNGIFCLLA